MGQPAARQGDMTAHGGVIMVGQPTVLIGGMPAARVADMHVCPMFNGPQPHVGGPITLGSSGVLIGGMPAARQGDMATCAGPPDMIVMGCPTVLIGEVSPASAGVAGAAGGAGAAGAQASAATAQHVSNESTTKREHWVEFEFVDEAGNPVSGVSYELEDPDGNVEEGQLRLDGTVRRDALSGGEATVTLKNVYGVEWSASEAEPGQEVTITAEAEGFEDGTPATIQVLKRDLKRPDVIVEEIETEVRGEEVETKWTFEHDEDTKYDPKSNEKVSSPGRSASKPQRPVYLAEVDVEGYPRPVRTGPLKIKSMLTIGLKKADGEGVSDEPYVVRFSNGEVCRGRLDSNGRAQLENVPPCRHEVMWPERSGIQRIAGSE